MPRGNMQYITPVIALVVVVAARLSFGEEIAPLRCYICVTDYENASQDPGCSIPGPNVIIRSCAVQQGFDRCISYRARNSRTGRVIFRRHCATQEMCEYRCLFSHHTNCQRTCCHGELCNVVSFGEYVGTTEKPELSKTTKDPVTTQNPNTTPKDDPTESSQSTRSPKVTQRTTDAPPTTYKISTTVKSLVGGPPITSLGSCHDYREQCPEYAAYPGYCQYTREFMILNCPRSCQFCGNRRPTPQPTSSYGTTKPSTTSPAHSTSSANTEDVTTNKPGNGGVGGPTGCEDARVQCGHFSNFDGYCQYHYGFMLAHCPRSCYFCDDVLLPESPVQKTTTEKPTTNEQEIITNEQPQLKTTPFGPGGPEFENSGCIDLRENCTHYATTYEDYCDYNQDYMEIYCPFSCGFCGSNAPSGAFPHPPVIYEHQVPDQEFPPPPSKKDARWLTSYCAECHNGLQQCVPKCILLLNQGNYELTSNDVCVKLLGKPKMIFSC